MNAQEHITALEAENERLRTESEERLQNCAALISENERLRSELARPESTEMTLMRTLVQSQAAELAVLRDQMAADRKQALDWRDEAAQLRKDAKNRPGCQTCQRFINRGDGCTTVVVCDRGSEYVPVHPVHLWGKP